MDWPEISFGNEVMKFPIWVSSMTGGTEKAGTINRTLAKACGKFGLGMGLGSCRIILEDDTYLPDFQLRKEIGDSAPLYANLGIAQIESLLKAGKVSLITELIDKTESNGLIIHINPLQEWLQPEGDRYNDAPVNTIERLMDKVDLPLILKEVGQGLGPASLEALLSLPLRGLEFGALGGTNFSKLELSRNHDKEGSELVHIGHTAYEMVDFINEIILNGLEIKTENLIVSGGIKNYLDGYYCITKLQMPSIYAQASAMLKVALQGDEATENYIEEQIRGLALSKAFLQIRE